MKLSHSTTRSAFTLVELLVVIGIMLALAALAAAVLPALRQKNNSAKAAAQVQGYLSISKQQAIRDRSPRGIRLVLDPSDPMVVRALQYIEVPDPSRFIQYPQSSQKPSLQVTQVAGDFDLHTILIKDTQSDWNSVGAQPNDYLVLTQGSSTFFFELFSNMTVSGSGPSALLSATVKARSGLAGLFPTPLPKGPASAVVTDFVVVRRARPMVGEPLIQLPPKMTIDLNYCAVSKPLPAAAPTTNYDQLINSLPICLNSGFDNGNIALDILFSADGELLGTVTNKLILCVKPEDGAAGEATLVVIYARTGAIVLQSVAVNTLPPVGSFTVPSSQFDSFFFFTQDGAGSGL
ncbi:prepilin-type N-terminal cleavage/methylation domain-containing protein [Zavarzinella formosa]|uniref:prepilin-type N-terminal cleavage/methylation domain-containing protein n=1 Tax=Zavarzinella formosa TaxID=360055 RepID=UPI0002ECF7F2|nr:prepilin-type N-terminal cleavage/methylation domain-containing protein [Zavarzinella formosa]